MRGFTLPLSRRFGALVFVLVTFCLDDGSIDSFLVHEGRARRHGLPDARHEWHWNEARKHFRIHGDAVYDSEDARSFAENGMLDEALDHWDRQISETWSRRGARSRTLSPRPTLPQAGGRRSWSKRTTGRDLEFERLVAMTEIATRSTPRPPGRRGRG